jgi:hypothetical protein
MDKDVFFFLLFLRQVGLLEGVNVACALCAIYHLVSENLNQ